GDIYLFDESGHLFAEFGDVRYGRLSRAMLERVAKTRRTPALQKDGLTRSALLAAAPEQRQRLLETYLRETVSHVLGLSPAQLDETQPLVSLIDSLMAVELKTVIEGQLEIDLPIAHLLGGDTLAELVAFLMHQ